MNSKSNVSGWTKAPGGARYSGVGLTTYRSWLRKGLRHARLPSGTVLVKFSWIDEFLKKYEVKQQKDEERIDQIISAVMSDL